MKRTIKQITAMLLVVIMCVSAPTTALAEGTVAAEQCGNSVRTE